MTSRTSIQQAPSRHQWQRIWHSLRQTYHKRKRWGGEGLQSSLNCAPYMKFSNWMPRRVSAELLADVGSYWDRLICQGCQLSFTLWPASESPSVMTPTVTLCCQNTCQQLSINILLASLPNIGLGFKARVWVSLRSQRVSSCYAQCIIWLWSECINIWPIEFLFYMCNILIVYNKSKD